MTGDEAQGTMGRRKKMGRSLPLRTIFVQRETYGYEPDPKTLHCGLIDFPGDSKVSATSPLSPSELLVALHQIEAKSDMKSVMKGTFVSCG